MTVPIDTRRSLRTLQSIIRNDLEECKQIMEQQEKLVSALSLTNAQETIATLQSTIEKLHQKINNLLESKAVLPAQLSSYHNKSSSLSTVPPSGISNISVHVVRKNPSLEIHNKSTTRPSKWTGKTKFLKSMSSCCFWR